MCPKLNKYVTEGAKSHKMAISRKKAAKQKNKGTLFSQTFKV